eukprot:3656936-Amphidinium_carterae.1
MHISLFKDGPAFGRRLAVGEGKDMKYSSRVMVAAVQNCTLLRNSADLKQSMLHAITLLLPDSQKEAML